MYKDKKIHTNVTTGKAYGEKNSEILDNTDFKSTFWATVPQYDKFKARVKKDERGIPITYFAPAIKKEDKDKEEEDRKKKFVPRKCYLFNVEQLQDTNILIKNLKEKGTLKEEDFKDLIMVLEDKKEEKGIKIDKNKVIFNEGKEESNKEKLRKIGKKRRKEAEEKERAREEAIKKINEEEKASEKEDFKEKAKNGGISVLELAKSTEKEKVPEKKETKVKEKKISKRSIEHSLTQKQKLIKRSEELKEDENMYDYILFDKKPKKYTFGDTLLKLFRSSRDRIYNIIHLLKGRIDKNTYKIDGIEKNVKIINQKLNIKDSEEVDQFQNEEDEQKIRVQMVFNKIDKIKEYFSEISEIVKDSEYDCVRDIGETLSRSTVHKFYESRHQIDFDHDFKKDILVKLWEEEVKKTFLPKKDQDELMEVWGNVSYTTKNVSSFFEHIKKEKDNYISKNSEKAREEFKNWGLTINKKYQYPYAEIEKHPKRMRVDFSKWDVEKFADIVGAYNGYDKCYFEEIEEAYNENGTYNDEWFKVKFYTKTAHITFL